MNPHATPRHRAEPQENRGSAISSEADTWRPLVSHHEVLQATGYSRGGLNKAINRGTFPAPLRIGLNRIAWHRSTLEKWLAERMAESETIVRARAARADRSGAGSAAA